MPKTSIRRTSRRPARPTRIAAARAPSGSAFSPQGSRLILWEGVAICHSQWCEVIGYPREAHTPIVDTLHEYFEPRKQSIRESIAISL